MTEHIDPIDRTAAVEKLARANPISLAFCMGPDGDFPRNTWIDGRDDAILILRGLPTLTAPKEAKPSYQNDPEYREWVERGEGCYPEGAHCSRHNPCCHCGSRYVSSREVQQCQLPQHKDHPSHAPHLTTSPSRDET